MIDPKKHARVTQQIVDCTKCALSRTSGQPVALATSPTVEPELAIIGEAPGKQEADQGIPFVGRSGAVLDETLLTIGTSRDQVGILNVVCCRPPKNRDPKPEEIDACSGHFNRQIRLLDVGVGVLLGNAALRALRGPRVGITMERGKAFWANGMVWMPTFHPAYILRNPSKRVLFTDDLGMAWRISQGISPLPDIAIRDAVHLLQSELGGEVAS